ncbi:MAG: excinuclease ABC subunit UvrC, partial [Actinobacteria bacterium]|nr:excinuclease ABC subunit UvrC [Actinomycetota bacterium]
EALMLEYTLIQRHKPRFNVRYMDDKSYPFLAVTTLDDWPRAMVMRGKRKKGNRYFGPYGQAYAIRDTLDLLLRTFPIRTCTDNKFRHHERLGKPCLLFHIEKQQMVFPKNEDADVIGIHDDELEAAVQVFFVRKGRVMGRRGFVVDKAEELDRPELVSRVLERLYFDDNPIGWPKEVLVPELPADPALYEEWLSELRESKVTIRVPQRGDKRKLHATVTQNAEESFTRHRLKRSSDHNSRARALNELQDYLDLPHAPLRIECYDMSHIQGTDYVGSMVVVEDGLPKKSEYRRFKIKTVDGNDDFAAMEEVLTRRFTAYLADREQPIEERDGKFAYPPQLLVVDGGKGQLTSAVRVLDELGLREEIPVISLAKQFEEVFVPGQSESIRLPRQSEALFMLQRIRDESHRFAITFHRQLRDKRMTKSALDGIPGLGPTRKKRLAKELGGVNAVKRADLETLKALSWLPDEVAENVFRALHRRGG